ncbi:MAG: stage III sporulation protein AF, partial [Anaerotignum sp.]|nr:stage III sporulation protein AF [Anaerotignum sp.]
FIGMMEAFTAYIKTITALTIFSALVGILLPEGKYRRYAELVLGIMVLGVVLEPLLRLLGT